MTDVVRHAAEFLVYLEAIPTNRGVPIASFLTE
jgi:hypothetical protein